MYSAPGKLVKEYWRVNEDKLKEEYKSLDDFQNEVLSTGPEWVERMATELYENVYAPANVPLEKFEHNADLPAWRDEQPSWLEVVGSKIATRAMDLGAGMATTVDAVGDWLEEKVPLGGIDFDKMEYLSPDEYKKQQAEGKNVVEETATVMRNSVPEYGLEDYTSWEEFKEAPATLFIPFAMEHGLASLPDMAAAVVNLPAYVLARTGEIGTDRAANQMDPDRDPMQDLDSATIEDLVYSFPTAVGVSVLERIGAAKMFGLTDTLKDTTIKEIAKAGGRRSLAEGATEAVQEPTEQVGAGIDTKRWQEMSGAEIGEELLQASAQGAVVGLGFGGAVGTTTAGAQAVRRGKKGDEDTETEELTPEEQELVDEGKAKAADVESVRQADMETLDEAAEVKRTKAAEAVDVVVDESAAPPTEPPAEPDAEGVVVDETAPVVDETAVAEAEIEAAAEPEPAVEQSVESMVLEEEVANGTRRTMSPSDVQPGDRVVVDDGVAPPETGVVEKPAEGLVRVIGPEGAPLAVIRPDNPAETDPILYTAPAEEADVELETATAEMGRLIKRVQSDPMDKGARDSLQKLRNSPDFQKLPGDARDVVDDFLRDADRKVEEAEVAAKAEPTPEPEAKPEPTPEPEPTTPPQEGGTVYRGVSKGSPELHEEAEGIWFSSDRGTAEIFAGEDGAVQEATLDTKNSLVVDAGGSRWSDVPTAQLPDDFQDYSLPDTASTTDIAELAKSLDYDSVVFNNVVEGNDFNNPATNSVVIFEEVRARPTKDASPEPEPEETAAPPKAEPGRPAGEPREVLTPAGRRVEVAPEIVEAADLIASHDEGGTVNPDFPEEVQPRDRSRKASQAQINEMAANLEPDLLMPTAQSSEGAPIIGDDNVVESGNARTLAIAKAYRDGGAEGYRGALEKQGYDVAGMDMPVLVQRRTKEMTPEERAEFAREANARTTADRGASEVAASDAESLGPEILERFAGGQVTAADNREFVRQFVDNVVPSSERASMTTANGELSQQGVQRIENAMFMGAYGEPEILSRLREDTDTNIKAIGTAMIDAAPEWAAMRSAAAEERIDPKADVTEHLVEAVNLVRKSRDEGQPLTDLVNQTEMFTGEAVDPLTEGMLRIMYKDPGEWKEALGAARTADAMRDIVSQANKTVPGENLFGEETDVPGMLDVARKTAVEGLKGAPENQTDTIKSEESPDLGEGIEPAGGGGGGPTGVAPQEGVGEASPPEGGRSAPAEEGGVEPTPEEKTAARRERSPRYLAEEEADNIRRDLREILGRIVPDAKLKTEDIDVAGAPQGATITGMYEQRDGEAVIHVALKGNPRETLRHEAIHALKNMGLFTKAEWSALRKSAESKKWIEKHGISERYPGMFSEDGSIDEAAYEEAIADEFAAWIEGRKDAGRGTAVRRMFERMREFFREMAQRLRVYGATPTPGNIFDAVERGEVGARQGIETPAFKEWFGDSKVADKAGNPIRVYHGTGSDFSVFENRSDTDLWAADGGFYFSDSTSLAGLYSTKRQDATHNRPNIMPVYLAIKNPKRIHIPAKKPKKGKRVGEHQSPADIAQAKAEGYDGVHVTYAPMYKGEKPLNVWIAFEPTQIKSATGNVGTFDPSNPDIKYHAAFHGSPHEFDKFSTEKIGSGEGYQTYGWGLYFASNKKVAEYYRESLNRGRSRQFSELTPEENEALPSGIVSEIEMIGRMPNPETRRIQMERRLLDVYRAQVKADQEKVRTQQGEGWQGAEQRLRSQEPTLAALEKIAASDNYAAQEPSKPLYGVELAPTQADYLSWDYPLSKQSKKVKAAVKEAYRLTAKDAALLDELGVEPNSEGPSLMDTNRGAELYRQMSEIKGGDKAASEALLAAGIRGIKYRDGATRDKEGEGSYNYVIFDEQDVEITQKFKVEFQNPETEKRWQEASKGVTPTKAGRISEAIRQEAKRWTRSREHLPNEAKFSDAREKMVHLEQAEHVAKEEISGLFEKVMGKLEQPDIDLLTRKMVLDDLLWTTEQGMDLPFGLKGVEDVMDALHGVEAAIEAKPELKERLAIRTEAKDKLKDSLISNGVLNAKQARNPNYFRHQVLEYAQLRATGGVGGSGKVKSPYVHSRKGSEKDINANYFQAEADWMYKAHQDIATAKFLNWLRTSQYNRKKEFANRAREENNDALNAKLKEDPTLVEKYGKPTKNLEATLDTLRKTVAARADAIRQTIPKHLVGEFDRFVEGGGQRSIKNDAADNKIFGMVAHLAESDLGMVNSRAAAVLSAVSKRRRFLADTLGDQYINPQSTRQLVERYGEEDGLTIWQPDSHDGKSRAVHIFTGKTVTEHVLDRAVDKLDQVADGIMEPEQIAELKDMLQNRNDIRMIGGPMEELVIPQEVADTLNDFHDEGAANMLDALTIETVGRWKQWTLFNPARFAKYYLNNMTGDFDALLATPAGIGVARKIPQAWREVKAMIKTNELTDGLRESLDKGVVQSSLVMQEITARGDLARESFRPTKVKGVLKYGSKYFDKVQNIARVRESAFRYAAYLHYKEEFAKGKTLDEIGYGASPPWMVEGITDPIDKAARMARDLLGDYGSIPHRAKWARTRMIPFVSWIASNTTRYNNLFLNAYRTGRDTSKAKGVGMGTVAAGSLLGRMFIFYAAVNLFNNFMFPDEEESLGTEERLRLHLILGKWGGEVQTLRFQGALSDYLGWFGLEDAGALLSEVQKGRASVPDVIKAIAKAPANKIGQAVTPTIKIPLELGLGMQFFPDMFEPRKIRDPIRHFSRNFSLDAPTAHAMKAFGKSAPTKSLAKTAAGILIYSRDPGQIAYDVIKAKEYRFLEKETGASGGGRMNPKSKALYNWRRAKKMGDKRSEELALKELRKYPRSGKSLRSSIKRAAPLGALTKNLRRKFIRTLSPKERDQLRRATQHYNSLR